jgi:Protein of unknown function (DUF3551)
VIRHFFIGLFIGVAVALCASAQAQVSQHPYCIQGVDNPGWSGCSFDTLQACQAAASGIDSECLSNPWYRADASAPMSLPPDGPSAGANNAQQSTGQLLIASGFNPVAATTAPAMARLTSFPANQFLLRNKGGHPYYFYADPTGCGCAYVGSVTAMKKYSASLGLQAADAPSSGDGRSSGGLTRLDQTMIDSMDNDDAGAQFNDDVFGPDP